MNKTDLIEAIVTQSGLSKAAASEALTATFDAIAKALSTGDKVSLIGFGTFQVSERAARTGKNPQTGEPIAIPAARVAKFKAGQKLKDAVSG